MGLKVRIPKKPTTSSGHPDYMVEDQSWVAREIKSTSADTTKHFWRILGLCAGILIVLIVAITVALISTNSTKADSITAADTFAISQTEQNAMKDAAQNFATGMILFAYCNDESVANEGKETALGYMATNTDSYNIISKMSASNRSLDKNNILVSVTTPQMVDGTQSYAGNYEYKLSAAATDKQGNQVDNGYDFDIIFSKATDVSSDASDWVISYSKITKR